jgi:hypothetical protein
MKKKLLEKECEELFNRKLSEKELTYKSLMKKILKEKTNKEKLLEYLPILYDLFDNLLNVDSDNLGIRNSFKIKIELRPFIRIFHENTYNLIEKKATISSPNSIEAIHALISELYHHYQNVCNSKTINDILLLEGSERATVLKIIEKLSQKMEDLTFKKKLFIYTLAQRVEVLKSIVNHIRPNILYVVNPTYRMPEEVGYNIGAASVLMAEKIHGEKVYSDVFHGKFDVLPTWFHKLNDFLLKKEPIYYYLWFFKQN